MAGSSQYSYGPYDTRSDIKQELAVYDANQ